MFTIYTSTIIRHLITKFVHPFSVTSFTIFFSIACFRMLVYSYTYFVQIITAFITFKMSTIFLFSFQKAQNNHPDIHIFVLFLQFHRRYTDFVSFYHQFVRYIGVLRYKRLKHVNKRFKMLCLFNALISLYTPI